MKAVVCLLVMLVAPLVSRAAPEIKGTVDVELGAQFPTNIAVKPNRYATPSTLIRFEPTNAVAPFVEYRATLHPDGRVMMIDAQRGVINARKEWTKLKDLVAKDHGAPQELDDKNTRASWRIGSRGIELVGFKENEDAYVRIVYFDKALLEKAKQDETPPSDKIEGMAGVNLGEPLPVQLLLITNGVVVEPGFVRFSTTNAPAPFKDCLAKLHPITQQVMVIAGSVDLNGLFEAENNWEKLLFLLTNKHGEPEKLDRRRHFARWAKEGRSIDLVGPNVNTPSRLSITYVDEVLIQRAK